MQHRYSEEVIRHRAVDQDGKPREILERVTRERTGSGEFVVVNRRYDLRTGERVSRVSGTEFEDDDGGRLVLA